MKLALSLLIVAIISTGAACGPIESGKSYQGTKKKVDLTVIFVDHHKKPAPGITGYILETFGNGPRVITETFSADQKGRIHLNGEFCFPLTVAVDGGGIVIQKEENKSIYSVEIRKDGIPKKIDGYGVPRPDVIHFKKIDSYRRCSA